MRSTDPLRASIEQFVARPDLAAVRGDQLSGAEPLQIGITRGALITGSLSEAMSIDFGWIALDQDREQLPFAAAESSGSEKSSAI